MADDQLILPIIDSHVHLYPKSELNTLTWIKPDSDLTGQHSLDEYKEAAKSAPSLLGFVFVETDRDVDTDKGEEGWKGALTEVSWIKRVALGQPKEGEGHTAEDAKLCLGIVPWAPVVSGPTAVEKYLDLAKEAAGDSWSKVKGFRYLVQGKPHGTMLEQNFIDAIKLLGKRGYIFELGVDQSRRGNKQLEETIEMIERVHDGVPEEEKTGFILNHLCKPDFNIINTTTDRNFHAWRTAMYTLSKASKTYMKLSGGFSQMPSSLKEQAPSRIFEATLSWLGIILATFGPSRIMFGSDWPVCAIGLGNAWGRWRDVVEKMCYMASLSDEDRAMIFGGTAKVAYGL